MEAHPEIIALDATNSSRPQGGFKSIFPESEKISSAALMADCSTNGEMLEADRMGFVLSGATLVGYTSQSRRR